MWVTKEWTNREREKGGERGRGDNGGEVKKGNKIEMYGRDWGLQSNKNIKGQKLKKSSKFDYATQPFYDVY